MKKIGISMTAESTAINKSEVFNLLSDLVMKATAKYAPGVTMKISKIDSARYSMKQNEDILAIIGHIGFAEYKINFRAHGSIMEVSSLNYRGTVIGVPDAMLPTVKSSEDAVDGVVRMLVTHYHRDPERVKKTVAELERERDSQIAQIAEDYAKRIKRARETNLTLVK